MQNSISCISPWLLKKPFECDGRQRVTVVVLPLGLALCGRSGANYRLLHCTWLGAFKVFAQIKFFFLLSAWFGLAHYGYFLSLCIGCTVSITPWLPIRNENKFQLMMFCNTMSVGHKCCVSC